MAGSQVANKLFQVLYLGSTTVDVHCSHTVLPWIAEELKLTVEQRVLTWVTPGERGVSYVADSGVELFHHTYSNILRCATSSDGITFSYILREREGACYACHVFQCLTREEADQLMKKLKASAKGETMSLSTIQPSDLPSSTIHTVQYVGSISTHSAAHSSDLLDSLLGKLHTRRRRKLGRKGIVLSQGQQQLQETTESEVDKCVGSQISESASAGKQGRTDDHITSSLSASSVSPNFSFSSSQPNGQTHTLRDDSCDVAIRLTRATPERMFRNEDMIEGHGERDNGEAVDGGDTEVEKSLSPFSERADGLSLCSDDDEDSHTTGSTTSCNTPDPTTTTPVGGDIALKNGISPTNSDPKLFQEQQSMRLLTGEMVERPASCPPLDQNEGTPEENGMAGEGNGEAEDTESDWGTRNARESTRECGGLRSVQSRDSGGLAGEIGGHSVPVQVSEQETVQQNGGREGERTDEPDTGFDTLPELNLLRNSPQFKALGSDGEGRQLRRKVGGANEEVGLVISPNVVQVVEGSKVILRRTIRSIVCCTQAEKRAEFVGFVCREGQSNRTFICHIFKAPSQAMATAVMDSFKSSFQQALNSSPSAMCDSCPLKQLHLLCQNLEGVPTPVAQSRIQQCLSQLSEADYNCIMSEYKSSEHADHEFTQLVVLVSLIREHLQKKQQEHVHPISGTAASDDLQIKTHEPVKPVRLSPLERAKLALASSFDNLRKGSSGRSTERRQRQFGKSLTTDDATPVASAIPSLATEDRRASLDPKVLATEKGVRAGGRLGLERSCSARVPGTVREGAAGDSSGGEETSVGRSNSGGGRSRTGSWFQRLRSSKSATVTNSSQEEESDGELQQRKKVTVVEVEEGRRESSPMASSSPREGKEIKPAQKLERYDSKEELDTSQPATSTPPTKNKPTPPPSPSALPPGKSLTPTHVPAWNKPNVRIRRAHTRASFSLPPNEGASQAYTKYRREHKRSESMSWRHEIFESVTPVKERTSEKFQLEWEIIEPASFDQLGRGPASSAAMASSSSSSDRSSQQKRREGEGGRGSPRSVGPRERWRRAIEQQIMLQRMEKENQSLMKASTEADIKRLKLCYQDPTINVDSMNRKWAELLSRPHPLDQAELTATLMEGVTPARRGEVWSLLIQQYKESHPSHLTPPQSHSFTELSHMSTDFENTIVMDLGRTFPSHPYFSTAGGQRALANILHGYAVCDEETGYCQGLSFLAGMILMHMKDEEMAYELLCQIMFVYSYRDVYSRDLSVLQIRLYQLSRLLHDVLPTLHSHLGMHEITPFYYAAPWFLTLFSSQFPIAFVARVMDLFFLDGPDIVFKVSVALLRYYEAHILRCSTMEAISEFLKEGMPQLVVNHMTTILDDAHHMDLEMKLQNFETEYFVLEELTTSFSVESDAQDLKSLNESFKSHNKELIDQLAYCRGMISNLESVVTSLQETVREQQRRIERLEAVNSLPASLSPETNFPPSPSLSQTEPAHPGSQTHDEPNPSAVTGPPPTVSPSEAEARVTGSGNSSPDAGDSPTWSKSNSNPSIPSAAL